MTNGQKQNTKVLQETKNVAEFVEENRTNLPHIDFDIYLSILVEA